MVGGGCSRLQKPFQARPSVLYCELYASTWGKCTDTRGAAAMSLSVEEHAGRHELDAQSPMSSQSSLSEY